MKDLLLWLFLVVVMVISFYTGRFTKELHLKHEYQDTIETLDRRVEHVTQELRRNQEYIARYFVIGECE